MPGYHVIHTHDADNCFGAPNANEEIRDLWAQIKTNAEENNVKIQYFKVNPSEHIFFMLFESEDYSNVERTIGQCKKTGNFTVTPVIDHPFF